MTDPDPNGDGPKAPPNPAESGLVYVVDDHGFVRTSVRQVLERAGFRVEEFENGRQAIKASFPNPPGLVLCDIFMPDCDGYELIIHFRKTSPSVPVVAMSGGGPMTLTDILRIGRGLGAQAGLIKPFSRAELLQVIEDCLGPRAGGS